MTAPATGAAALTVVDLQRFIEEHSISATLIADIGATPTVPAAAAALGVDTDHIIKTLLFLVDVAGEGGPRPVVVISHGEKRIDKRLLALRWGVGKKRVVLAAAEVVLDLLGYPAGGVPPFGHRSSLPVILDAAILDLDSRNPSVVYGGGGDDRTMMRLTVQELVRVTQPEILALSQSTQST